MCFLTIDPGTEATAKRAMHQLVNEADSGLTEEEMHIHLPICAGGGARTRKLVSTSYQHCFLR